MKWYRAKLRVNGKAVEPIELRGHDAADAAYCAAVRAGRGIPPDELELQFISLECIEEPDWSIAARAAAMQATRPVEAP